MEKPNLPNEVDLEVDSCLADAIEDDVYVESYINNYLSDKYGYCMWDYDYEIVGNHIHISNIEWDTSE